MRAPKSSRRVFLGRFPAGKPGLAAAAAGAGWEVSRLEADTGAPATLHLVGGAGHATLVGTSEASQVAPYYLFMMRQEGVIDAVPSGPWFTFRPEMRSRGALTLEEAEARMKARSRAGETAGGWLARAGGAAAATRALPVGGGDAGGGGDDGGDSDSEKVRRGGAGSEDDSEEEEAPRKRRGKGGAPGAEGAGADGGADGDGEEPEAAAAPDGGRRRGGGGGESPDRGEDWEHEGAMTDDDEAVGVGDQIEEEEDVAPPPPAAEADVAEEGLDEEGQKMRKLLLAQRKGEGVEDEDDDDDEGDMFEDDDAFEDEDFMDPDTDTRLSKLVGMRQAADAGAPAADAGAAPLRTAVKRPRSPEADAAAGTAAPAAKMQRVMSETAAAELAEMEANCGITLVQLTEALTPPQPITVRAGVSVVLSRCADAFLCAQDLMKRFKRNLKTEVAKTAFKELLRRFARVEGGKLMLK